MARYKWSAVPIQGGLDFANPRSIVEPGRLIDCLNYEHIDNSGIKRIDGFIRWDGGCDVKSEQMFTMIASLSATPSSGDILLINDGYTPTGGQRQRVFGVVVRVDARVDLHATANEIHFFYIDPAYSPRLGASIYKLNGPTSTSFQGALSSLFTWVRAPYKANYTSTTMLGDTIGGNTGGYETYNGPMSPSSYMLVSPITDNSAENFAAAPVLGGCYFKDKFYGVVDSAIEIKATDLERQVYPNDILTNSAGTAAALVVKSTLTAGSWTGSTSGDTATIYAVPIMRQQQIEDRVRGVTMGTTSPSTGLQYLARNGRQWTTQATQTINDNDAQAPALTASIWKSFSENASKDYGGVYSVTVTDPGAGYDSAPAVSFTGGGGTGAKAYAIMTGSAGALTIASIVVTDPGKGYTSAPTVVFTGGTPTVTFEGAATATLMNFGHSGLFPNHNGWLVKFDEGTSPSNYFTKINRDTNINSQTTTYTTAPTTSSYPRKVLTGLDFTDAINNSMAQWYPSSGTDLNAATILDDLDSDSNNGINVLMRESDANHNWQSNTIGFTQFQTNAATPMSLDALIPQNSVIQGITVNVIVHADVAASLASQIGYLKLRCNLFTTANNTVPAQSNPTDLEPARTETRHGNTQEQSLNIPTVDGNLTSTITSTSPIVFGSSTDLWGLVDKRDDFFRNPNFGVALSLHAQRTSAGTFGDVTFQIEKIELIINYGTGTSKYYFSDGTGNVMSAQLVDYTILSGSLKNKDAVGYMQLSKLEQAAIFATTPISSIVDNMSIYADSGLSAKIGVVDGAMTYNGLPNYASIENERSRYKIQAANFYGNEDWECIYGVSGAGRAFEFDGNYFTTLFALPPETTVNSNTVNDGNDEKDKPRHVTEFAGRLALGYSAGSVLFSRAGYPTVYSGVQGAGEVAFGDSITGLAPLNGDYLGVFCENKIFGMGQDFTKKILSPNSGAIEYTLQMLGNMPIYCDSQGIATLSQSDKYGDFMGQRLSKDVYPWLRGRISGASVGLSGSEAGVVDSYVVRAKNHYRLWFKDGYQLTMNYSGEGSTPQFTLSRFYLKNFTNLFAHTNSTAIVLPTFISSNVADSGEEFIFFYPDISKCSDTFTTGVYNVRYIAPYLFRMEKFWYFDGPSGAYLAIPAYFQTNYWNKENPFARGTIRKVRIEGLSRNIAPITVITAKEYETADIVNGRKVDIPLSSTSTTGLTATYENAQKMANVAESSRLISFTFLEGLSSDSMTYPNYQSLSYGFTYGPANYGPNPPHYIQILLLQHEEGREDA